MNIIFDVLLWAFIGALPGFYICFLRGYDTRLGLAGGAITGIIVGIGGLQTGIVASPLSAVVIIIGLMAAALLLLPEFLDVIEPEDTHSTQRTLLTIGGGAAIILFLLVGIGQSFFGVESILATVLTVALLAGTIFLSRETDERAAVIPSSLVPIIIGVIVALGVFSWIVNTVAIVFLVAAGIIGIISLIPRGTYDRRQSTNQRITSLAYALTVPTVLIVMGIVIFPVIWNVIFSLRDIEVADLQDVQLFDLSEVSFDNYVAQAGLRFDTVPCETAEDGSECLTDDDGNIDYVRARSYFDDYRGWRELTSFPQGEEQLVVGARDDEFYPMMFRTIFYTLASTILAILFGLVAALIVREAFPGRAIFRGFILFPYIAPVISVAFVWDALLRQRGFINGLFGTSIDFLGTRDSFAGLAIPLIMVIAFQTWRYFPFAFLFLLARLQAIPEDMYEAAKVDGAVPSQRLWFITLPQLRAVFGTLFLLRFIWTFNKFDDIFLLTGPIQQTKVIPIQIFEALFTENNVGEASAVAVIMALVLAVILLIYFRYFMVEEA
jgi:multiple sugar transport system permease protein